MPRVAILSRRRGIGLGDEAGPIRPVVTLGAQARRAEAADQPFEVPPGERGTGTAAVGGNAALTALGRATARSRRRR